MQRAQKQTPTARFPNRPLVEYSLQIVPATGSSRRASPLFLHVHEFDDDDVFDHALVVTFLPAVFLPEPGKVEIEVKQGSANQDAVQTRLTDEELMQVNRTLDFSPDWSILRRFLDDRPHPSDSRRSLDGERLELHGNPNRVRVWPR